MRSYVHPRPSTAASKAGGHTITPSLPNRRWINHGAIILIACSSLVLPAFKTAVRELILRGCNPNTGSGTGETAIHTMAAFGQVGCAKAVRALCGKELLLQPRDKVSVPPGGWRGEPILSRSPVLSSHGAFHGETIGRRNYYTLVVNEVD